LKPTWGLDAVYRVLDNPDIAANFGRFSLAELRVLWHEPRYTGSHLELLRLMQNFQLCYELPDDKDIYIAPQLLSENVPEYPWDKEENLQLRYHYPIFMPRGILSRAIVKLQGLIENQSLVWRAGVILRGGYARAEILELRGENQIRIRISGKNKRDLLMTIVRTLDELHRGFPKLRYDRLLPCNCTRCASSEDPHFFVLENLQERLAYSREDIECGKPPYEKVYIRNLIDDEIAIATQFGPEGPINHLTVHGDYVVGEKRTRYQTSDVIHEGGKHIRETHGDVFDNLNIADSTGVSIGRSADATVSMAPSNNNSEAPGSQSTNEISQASAWRDGPFYLFVLVIAAVLIATLLRYLSVGQFTITFIGSLVVVLLIGALQLKQQEKLADESFVTLIQLAFKQLPLIRRRIGKG
ncbi:MAG: hypothetical protein KDE34_20925, partial [Anaerolineales bacterium]|nr:hypothetical protein [Anaerolineales bacterium]